MFYYRYFDMFSDLYDEALDWKLLQERIGHNCFICSSATLGGMDMNKDPKCCGAWTVRMLREHVR